MRTSHKGQNRLAFFTESYRHIISPLRTKMPSKCSFCKAEDHNIRTCKPFIEEKYRLLLWNSMVHLTNGEDRYHIYNEHQMKYVFRRCIRDDLLDSIWYGITPKQKQYGIRGIAMQYCHQPGNADENTYIDSIVGTCKQ